MASTTPENVIAALEVLYQPHLQTDQVQNADSYLRSFQITPDAYTIALHLLERYVNERHSPSSIPILFFASQTLANKLRRQHAVPPSIASWSYLDWSKKIIHWLSLSLPKIVSTQLILALVACIPRFSPISQSSHADKNSTIGLLIDLLSCAKISSTLVAEVLVVIAEELSDVHDRTIRQHMFCQLDTWAMTVVHQMLPQLMQEAIQKESIETQEIILRATTTWIRYARLNVNGMESNPLIQSFKTFLQQEMLFDVTVELILELIHKYQHDLGWIEWLVPQLLSLHQDYTHAFQMENIDQCIGFCRIFTEMGQTYLSILMQRTPLITSLLQIMLECMTCLEMELIEITLSFWFDFIESHPRGFETQLMCLTQSSMRILHFPNDFLSFPYDKQHDFKTFRQEMGDLLRECCLYLRIESILNHCVESLQSICQLSIEQQSWQAIEAHLYCIRSIGRNIEQAQINGNDMSGISPLIELIFQHLPQFACHPSIQYTACLIISRYALWLHQHSHLLPTLLSFIHQCIVSSQQQSLAVEWQVSSAAAMALRSLAMDCWSFVGSEVLRFYLFVESQEELMNVEDQVLILEGICTGVSRSHDVSIIISTLEQVLEPIVRRLHHVLTVSQTDQVNSTLSMQQLLRLLALYDYTLVESMETNPLLLITERIWNVMDLIFPIFRYSDEWIERMVRCYKRMLRSCGPSFASHIPHFMETMITLYIADPKGTYLYMASMILKQSLSQMTYEMQTQLITMIERWIVATLPLCQTTEQTEIIEEFLYLMERVIRSLPSLFLESNQLLSPVLMTAIGSLDICHNEVNRATLSFLEQALICAKTESINPPMAPMVVNLGIAIKNQVELHGQVLMDKLLRGIVLGTVSRTRLDEEYGSIAGVLLHLATIESRVLTQWMDQWFEQACTSPQLSFLTRQETREFQQELCQASNEREFRRVIRHFGKMCASRTESTELKV